MNVLFRVLVGAFVCVAPTVLFLGLWHGLKRMQDGELIEQVVDQQNVAVEDLVPGAQPHRTHERDSAERRALQRMTADDGSGEVRPESEFASDDQS